MRVRMFLLLESSLKKTLLALAENINWNKSCVASCIQNRPILYALRFPIAIRSNCNFVCCWLSGTRGIPSLIVVSSDSTATQGLNGSWKGRCSVSAYPMTIYTRYYLRYQMQKKKHNSMRATLGWTELWKPQKKSLRGMCTLSIPGFDCLYQRQARWHIQQYLLSALDGKTVVSGRCSERRPSSKSRCSQTRFENSVPSPLSRFKTAF